MNKKIDKYFTVTETQKEKLDTYKEETGMTFSAIVEKSLLSLLNSNEIKIQMRTLTARNKDYVGELCNIRVKVYLKDEVVNAIEKIIEKQNEKIDPIKNRKCNFTDAILSAISFIIM